MIKIFGVGRLTDKPETRELNESTKILVFTIASNNGKDKDGKEKEADFLECKYYVSKENRVDTFLKKGDKISFAGNMKTEKWTTKEGQNRIKNTCIIDDLDFEDVKFAEEKAE